MLSNKIMSIRCHSLNQVWPHMANLKYHFKNILYNNFDAYREPLKIKFGNTSTRTADAFSIRYVDGFSKGLIVQSIIAMVDKIETRHACRMLHSWQ